MTRTWVEISRGRFLHNLTQIRQQLPDRTALIAVVKANAYGHGVSVVAPWLVQEGVDRFAVATVQEGIELRRWAHHGEILVLGGCGDQEAADFRRYRLHAAHFLADKLPETGVPYELKVDTGMTRLGIPWTEVARFLESVPEPPAGIYSHFACAENDPGFSQLQLKRLLEATSGRAVRVHIASSAALRFEDALLDGVRVGLALYGIAPTSEIEGLQPVLTWKSRVLAIQSVPVGRTVGYGGTFRTQRNSRLAVIGVGYGDGYRRALSNRAAIRIRGQVAPLAGRVSMDLATADVTEVIGATVGDVVTLLQADSSSPLSAEALARTLGTIPYEVLTGIGPRVERVAVD